MLYSPGEAILIALIMTFGSLVQGAVGFASGLLGVPLLVLCNFSLPEAATVNLMSTGIQNATGAWRLWSHLEPSELVFPVAVRILAIPLGTFVAWWANEYLAPAQAKQAIGAILLIIVISLWVGRVSPRESLGWPWQTAAFSISGFLLGFASIGGAPMVIYVNALTWTAAKSRAFLFFCSAMGWPIALAMFWWQHGPSILPALCTTLVVLPIILTGLWVGLRLGHRLSKTLFRKITYGLILLVAISSLLAPVLFH